MKFLYLSTALLIASSLVAMNNEDVEGHEDKNTSLYRLNNLDIFRAKINDQIKQDELSKPKEPNSLCGMIKFERTKNNMQKLPMLNIFINDILDTVAHSCKKSFDLKLKITNRKKIKKELTRSMKDYFQTNYWEKEAKKEELCNTFGNALAEKIFEHHPNTEHNKHDVAKSIIELLNIKIK